LEVIFGVFLQLQTHPWFPVQSLILRVPAPPPGASLPSFKGPISENEVRSIKHLVGSVSCSWRVEDREASDVLGEATSQIHDKQFTPVDGNQKSGEKTS